MTENRDIEVDNTSFYANNFVIQVGSLDFFIDFQRKAPRFEHLDSSPHIVNEHSVIILNLVLFKQLIRVGSKLIEDLEKEFGDITVPEFVIKLTDKQQKALLERETNENENDRPPYINKVRKHLF